MIIGNAEHGKDTLTNLLCDHLSLDFASSSWVACEAFIFDTLRDEYGYTSAMECWIDRRRSPEMREQWATLIAKYNAADPTALAKLIFKHHDIYNGIRNYDECVAVKEAGLYQLAIGIDASERLPLEGSGSMDQRLFSLCDFIIPNNGTEAELSLRVDNIVSFIKGVRVND